MSDGKYPPYKASGMAYILFAKEEKELFSLLFRCNYHFYVFSYYFRKKNPLLSLTIPTPSSIMEGMEGKVIVSMQHGKIAKDLFCNGYNCAQAVFCSFSDVTGIDEKTGRSISSSLGGGLARLREVCGAVSGMAMVLGALYGDYDTKDDEAKKAHYARVREAVSRFQQETGSYICRELLGEQGKDHSPVPEPRTEQYYKKRPCGDLVALAAETLDACLQDWDYFGIRK